MRTILSAFLLSTFAIAAPAFADEAKPAVAPAAAPATATTTPEKAPAKKSSSKTSRKPAEKSAQPVQPRKVKQVRRSSSVSTKSATTTNDAVK